MLQITKQERDIVEQILREYVPYYPVWAFGSRVKGNARMYSDLDLVIINEEPLSLLTYSNLKEAFSESDLPWKVDIVDWSMTSEVFRHIIQEQYCVIQQGTSKTSG